MGAGWGRGSDPSQLAWRGPLCTLLQGHTQVQLTPPSFADAVPTDRNTAPRLTQEWNTSLGLGALLSQLFLPE